MNDDTAPSYDIVFGIDSGYASTGYCVMSNHTGNWEVVIAGSIILESIFKKATTKTPYSIEDLRLAQANEARANWMPLILQDTIVRRLQRTSIWKEDPFVFFDQATIAIERWVMSGAGGPSAAVQSYYRGMADLGIVKTLGGMIYHPNTRVLAVDPVMVSQFSNPSGKRQTKETALSPEQIISHLSLVGAETGVTNLRTTKDVQRLVSDLQVDVYTINKDMTFDNAEPKSSSKKAHLMHAADATAVAFMAAILSEDQIEDSGKMNYLKKKFTSTAKILNGRLTKFRPTTVGGSIIVEE